MVERLFSVQEAIGSMPVFSTFYCAARLKDYKLNARCTKLTRLLARGPPSTVLIRAASMRKAIRERRDVLYAFGRLARAVVDCGSWMEHVDLIEAIVRLLMERARRLSGMRAWTQCGSLFDLREWVR